ncbi:MAG: D-aminoacylase [Saccharopolyspora rectivirgula]
MSQPLLLTGAQLVDGTGAPPRPADVLIENGDITAVEPPGTLPTSLPTRDLTGLVLAPGFIDVHSHADNSPLLLHHDTTKISQGVTTEVVGNCGFSLAPHNPHHSAELTDFLQRLFPPQELTWSSFRDLFEVTDQRGYVTNYCPLVGHSTLRIAAMGTSKATPDATALRAMQNALEQALEAGVFGLSTGLAYAPATFARTEELCALAEVLGGHGHYVTHMRNESDELLDSIEEALTIGAIAGSTHISHLKAAHHRNWGSMPRAIERLRQAREAGHLVTQDVYPYTASSTMLASLLPDELLAGQTSEVIERLRSPDTTHRLQAELDDDSLWHNVHIASTASHHHEGQSIAEIAAAQGRKPVDVLVEILISERLQVSMIHFCMDETDLETALADPCTMVGSDGLPLGTGGKPHPRLTSTFPRLIARYSRDRTILPLGEAIRRITALPAERFGIPDRGKVLPGHRADLVAFSAERIADRGDYQDPMRPPSGIEWVCLGGKTAVEHGEYCCERLGARLLPV